MKRTTLGTLLAEGRSLISGPFGSNISSRFFVSTGVPVIRGNNLTSGMDRFRDEGFVYVTEEKADELRADAIADDVIFTAAGTIGQVGLIPHDGRFRRYVISNKQIRARLDHNQVDPLFAFYWFSSPQSVANIQAHNTGSTIPLINLSVVRSLPITLPELEVQKGIVELLGSLDDKIELNRRMNETLEAMAQAIFADWFVDFGPTRREIGGASDPVTIMGGLVTDLERARQLADLFPARLEDNGLPAGWQERPIGELAKLRGGKQLAKHEFDPQGAIPVFGGAGRMGFTNKHNAEGYVITVGRVGAYCGQFVAHRGQAWVNNNASLVNPNGDVPGEWLYLSLRQLDIDTIKKGAAQPFVSNSDIAALTTTLPPPEVLREFLFLIMPIVELREHNELQMATLATTRDLLLPKLMSGEIRLGEAKEQMEAAQ